jgi:hypothetical protein
VYLHTIPTSRLPTYLVAEAAALLVGLAVWLRV